MEKAIRSVMLEDKGNIEYIEVIVLKAGEQLFVYLGQMHHPWENDRFKIGIGEEIAKQIGDVVHDHLLVLGREEDVRKVTK